MPDFDTGHIFLTTMAPIRRPETDKDIPSEANDFYLRIIRAKLAGMHPARQSPATLKVQMSKIQMATISIVPLQEITVHI